MQSDTLAKRLLITGLLTVRAGPVRKLAVQLTFQWSADCCLIWFIWVMIHNILWPHLVYSFNLQCDWSYLAYLSRWHKSFSDVSTLLFTFLQRCSKRVDTFLHCLSLVYTQWPHLSIQHLSVYHFTSCTITTPQFLLTLSCLCGAVVGHRSRSNRLASSIPGQNAIKSTRSTQPSIRGR